LVSDVEERHIVMLKLDLSFPLRKVAIPKSEQLRFAE
jgi:hypothetical protein